MNPTEPGTKHIKDQKTDTRGYLENIKMLRVKARYTNRVWGNR